MQIRIRYLQVQWELSKHYNHSLSLSLSFSRLLAATVVVAACGSLKAEITSFQNNIFLSKKQTNTLVIVVVIFLYVSLALPLALWLFANIFVVAFCCVCGTC